MKYAKVLHANVQEMPVVFQQSSINYKQWKKALKQQKVGSGEMALEQLACECQRIDHMFVRCYKRINSILYTWFSCGRTNITYNQLDMFANTNATTVYKICKKICKSFDYPKSMKWLREVRTLHMYHFMGGAERSHLNAMVEKHIECPICLENDQRMYFILPCGHSMCTECAYEYAGVKEVIGLWYNKLAWSKRKSCPICRFPNALYQTESIQVYRP